MSVLACGRPVRSGIYERFVADKKDCQTYTDCGLVHSGSCGLPCIDAVANEYLDVAQTRLTELAETPVSLCSVDCLEQYADCQEGQCELNQQLPQLVELEAFISDNNTCEANEDCTVISQSASKLLPCNVFVNSSAITAAEMLLENLVQSFENPATAVCDFISRSDCIVGTCVASSIIETTLVP